MNEIENADLQEIDRWMRIKAKRFPAQLNAWDRVKSAIQGGMGETSGRAGETFRKKIAAHLCTRYGRIPSDSFWLGQADEIIAMFPAPATEPPGEAQPRPGPGVWCCERKSKCKWQGFALHQGLAWGAIPDPSNEWRIWHARECGGTLIQIATPEPSHRPETPDTERTA